jgi:hypothetical protein
MKIHFGGLGCGYNNVISKLSEFKSAVDLPPDVRCFFNNK